MLNFTSFVYLLSKLVNNNIGIIVIVLNGHKINDKYLYRVNFSFKKLIYCIAFICWNVICIFYWLNDVIVLWLLFDIVFEKYDVYIRMKYFFIHHNIWFMLVQCGGRDAFLCQYTCYLWQSYVYRFCIITWERYSFAFKKKCLCIKHIIILIFVL